MYTKLTQNYPTFYLLSWINWRTQVSQVKGDRVSVYREIEISGNSLPCNLYLVAFVSFYHLSVLLLHRPRQPSVGYITLHFFINWEKFYVKWWYICILVWFLLSCSLLCFSILHFFFMEVVLNILWIDKNENAKSLVSKGLQ